ncbi:MAG: tetratricopeptide repeat protein, partial [Acidobacteria bacterium]|nr:tetratricopeptide repeat protein [Acidobacteriota bacterium]
YREALELLERALAMDPHHLAARINRGVALARLGRVDEAMREYEAALQQDPDNEDARYNLQRARERLQGN